MSADSRFTRAFRDGNGTELTVERIIEHYRENPGTTDPGRYRETFFSGTAWMRFERLPIGWTQLQTAAVKAGKLRREGTGREARYWAIC